MIRSPRATSGWRVPQEPTRMKVGRSVIASISATTISTLSVPMPVETTETRSPRYVPVAEANSRCRRSSSTESKRAAIRLVRSGSPGRRMYSASSPGPSPMWYCRSPEGSATRWSAFGKPSSLAQGGASQARNSGEDRPAFERASSTVATHDPRTSRVSSPLASSSSAKHGKTGRHSAGEDPTGSVPAEARNGDGNDGRQRQSQQSRGARQSAVEEPAGELTCAGRVLTGGRLAGGAGGGRIDPHGPGCIAAGAPVRVAGPHEAGGIVDDDDEPAALGRDLPGCVDGIAGLEERDVFGRGAPEADPTHGVSVVEEEAIGRDFRDESTDANVLPDVLGEAHQVDVDGRHCPGGRHRRPGWWRRRRLPGRPAVAAVPTTPAGRAGPGGRTCRDDDVPLVPRDDRPATIRCARVGPPDEPDDRRPAPNREGRDRDPGARQSRDDDALQADRELRPPAIAQLVDLGDGPEDLDEPPFERRGRRTPDRHRHGSRPGREDLDA